MRSFQMMTILLFLGTFLTITYGTYLNLRSILRGNKKSILIYPFIVFHAIIILAFIYLYIYPNSPRTATNYSQYLIFNFVLFALFIFNLINSITFLLHFVFARRKSPVLPYCGLIVSLGFVLSMIFGTFGGTRQLKTENHELYFSSLPERFDNYRLLVFTDTHLGGMLFPHSLFKKASDIAEKVKPDIILFAGDLVNNFAYEIEGFESLFQQITRHAPSFSILGNHDYGDYTNWKAPELKDSNFNAIVNSNKELGFHLLRNEHSIITRSNDSIYIAGVENWGHPPFPQYADLEKAMKNIPDNAFTILLTHDPAHWESHVKQMENIQLTLSGHTHGMQWGIKLAGIPFSLAYLSRINWGGLYKNDNTALYVNTGFGTVGVPWRLDMPAEITIITLKRGKID